MKLKVVVVDFELSRRVKGFILRAALTTLGLGTLAIATTTLHTWADGDVLKAADLNATFATLQSQITPWKTYVVAVVDGDDGRTPIPNVAATGNLASCGRYN